PRIQSGTDLGPVDPSLDLPYVTLVLKPSSSQQADLDQLLAQQQDPSSPNYHRWLTPEQYAERFGVSQSDIDKIVSCAQCDCLRRRRRPNRQRLWRPDSQLQRGRRDALRQ
ncbi:MAG: protease pro-enzyme activation domain-containing protein, partial [Bryobacteraceae bacterium]